jgi:hypothetical protein
MNTVGTGEPLTVLMGPCNAGSNTAAGHIAVIRDALPDYPRDLTLIIVEVKYFRA